MEIELGDRPNDGQENGRAPVVLPEHLREQVKALNLRISLGKKSVRLSFSEELVRSSAKNAYDFVLKYTDYVIATLKKLSQPEKGDAGK